jgi:hypothetical protein
MTRERGPNDLDYLTWVAEGRAAMVPADVSARLLAAGLLVQTGRDAVDRQRFELSPDGLDHIRSSDQ